MEYIWTTVERLYVAKDVKTGVLFVLGSSCSLRGESAKVASEAASEKMGRPIKILRPIPAMRNITFTPRNFYRSGSSEKLTLRTEELIWLYDSMSEIIESWWNAKYGEWGFYDTVYTPGISVKTQKKLGALYQSDFFINFKVEGHDETIVMIGVLDYLDKIPMKEE